MIAGISVLTADRKALKDLCDPLPFCGHKKIKKSIALLDEKQQKEVLKQLKITEAKILVFICSRQEQMRATIAILLCLFPPNFFSST